MNIESKPEKISHSAPEIAKNPRKFARFLNFKIGAQYKVKKSEKSAESPQCDKCT
jgi:hypothetical protein